MASSISISNSKYKDKQSIWLTGVVTTAWATATVWATMAMVSATAMVWATEDGVFIGRYFFEHL